MINLELNTEVKQLMSADQIRHYGAIPLELEGDLLVLGYCSEAVKNKLQEISLLLDYKVSGRIITENEFEEIVSRNYRASAPQNNRKLQVSDNVLDEIITLAQNIGASDIHIEPIEKKTRIRLRVDGALKTFFELPLSDHSLLINKIKIKAGLNISEKRRNQDGRITQQSDLLKNLDIRVSALPSLHGEKIVLRLLETDQKELDISKIGFSSKQLEIFKRAYHKPNGIILISGPTGSGKTTTLYATLKELNDEKVNIMTVEDPIEYTINGINQVQVKNDIGFDFAAALKTFLRQDPDIIMIGEIRDQETAQMAVKASLTGHLVLSTIHTNSALGTIDRLKDMDIPSYLIANTLNLSVAQRLVRLLCKDCKQHSTEIIKNTVIQEAIHSHYTPKGCTNCHYTGYRGRTALFELLEIDEYITKAIKENKNDFNTYLTEKGFKSLKNQAFELFKNHKTSFEEIYPLLID
jgi:type IV pilus assembly protein PilB